jgi:hypothetical protein
MKSLLLTCILLSVQNLLPDRSAVAQSMIYTTTPLQSNSDRFFESGNMNWSLRGPNFFATFGGPNIGVPRFSGYNPNAGISSGWAFNSRKFCGNFGFNFSQGFERISATTAPSLMLSNGQTGQFFSGVRRQFVYSLVPVVSPGGGAFFSSPNPALQQQYRQPCTVAEQVLRGDVVLPKSQAATQYVPGSSGSNTTTDPYDPATERANSAYAWFQHHSQNYVPVSQRKPTTKVAVPSDLVAPPPPPAFVDPVSEPLKNPLSNVSKLLASSNEEASLVKTDATSASQSIAQIYFQRGLDAEADKDVTKAGFLFRMAVERASGDLRDRIEKRLENLPTQ